MISFSIPKGTNAIVVSSKDKYNRFSVIEHTTFKDNVFFAEDVVIDAHEIIETPKHLEYVANYFKNWPSVYAFKPYDSKWIIVVPAKVVETN